jgi:uncharacterized membrane protein YfcA
MRVFFIEAKLKAIDWILLSILTSGPFWGGFFGGFLMSMIVRDLLGQMLMLFLSMAGIWAVLVAAAAADWSNRVQVRSGKELLGSVPAN